LVTQSAASTDVAARRASYTATLQRLQQLRPNIYLYHDSWYLGLSTKLSGVVYQSDAIPRFTTASLSS
jgi:peptide/nickel transport system substrate-binding protein